MTESTPTPAADQDAVAAAAELAELTARREEEAKIAAEQDAALEAVRAECNAARNNQ